MSLYVYVAGPLSTGGYEAFARHLTNAIKAADALLKLGYVPFVPHLDHLWQLLSPKNYEEWLKWDFAWIDRCDVLLRLSGVSKGADREIEHAASKGIPVVYTFEQLFQVESEMNARRNLPA